MIAQKKEGSSAKTYKPHTRQCVISDDVVKMIREEKGKLKVIAVKYNLTTGYISKLRSRKAKPLV